MYNYQKQERFPPSERTNKQTQINKQLRTANMSNMSSGSWLLTSGRQDQSGLDCCQHAVMRRRWGQIRCVRGGRGSGVDEEEEGWGADPLLMLNSSVGWFRIVHQVWIGCLEGAVGRIWEPWDGLHSLLGLKMLSVTLRAAIWSKCSSYQWEKMWSHLWMRPSRCYTTPGSCLPWLVIFPVNHPALS